jgi:hypothetical protein
MSQTGPGSSLTEGQVDIILNSPTNDVDRCDIETCSGTKRMLSCFLFIGTLCTNVDVQITNTDTGLSHLVTAKAESFEVTVEIRTDNIVLPDKDYMELSCENESCLFYHKSCDTEQNITVCSYFVLGEKESIARQFTVTAQYGDCFNKAGERVFVSTSKDNQSFIRLSNLTRESQSKIPRQRRVRKNG